MLFDLVIVAGGTGVIVVLARVVIDRAVELSDHYGLSGGLVGLTLLAVGTSLPEIAAHVVGSLEILAEPEKTDTISGLLVGLNVGSDIFQQTFILPVVALVGAVVIARKDLSVEIGPLIGAAVLVWIFSLGGALTRFEGAVMLGGYMLYLVWLRGRQIGEEREARLHLGTRGLTWRIAALAASFVAVAIVADRVLISAVDLVDALGISASFFGVVVIGVGTSLPELTTALVAIRKGERDISAGILLGSNITNPLLGLGLGAVISGYTVPGVIVVYDLPFKIATACLIGLLFWRSERLGRPAAVILMALFFAYVLVRQVVFPTDVP